MKIEDGLMIYDRWNHRFNDDGGGPPYRLTAEMEDWLWQNMHEIFYALASAEEIIERVGTVGGDSVAQCQAARKWLSSYTNREP